MNHTGELLSLSQIRTKISKAINNRKAKLSDIQEEDLIGLTKEERVERKKNFTISLESKLNVKCDEISSHCDDN